MAARTRKLACMLIFIDYKRFQTERLDGSRSWGVARAHYCRWGRALVSTYAQLPFLSSVALLHMPTRTTVGVVLFFCATNLSYIWELGFIKKRGSMDLALGA